MEDNEASCETLGIICSLTDYIHMKQAYRLWYRDVQYNMNGKVLNEEEIMMVINQMNMLALF